MTTATLAPPRQGLSPETKARTIRCAIYTRKSTDEGLDQEFSSLDAQRESAEAYILSQRSSGWVALPARYDDGGFSGANLDRPAFSRLVADIEAGRVDCVVVYKVDRLSRSLFDFVRIIDVFDRHSVTFVSVTQQFNTTSSIGRLTLNIILSFAQFEREIISERTRDKVSAARRKGKWIGGIPVLGYDIDPSMHRLVVNREEAAQVRALFSMYLESQSLQAAAAETNRRGWTTKSWTKKDGADRQGKPFDKANLRRLLTNVVYIGKVGHDGQTYPGEQEAIVDERIFDRVGELLSANGNTGGGAVRNRHGALLKGLLRCRHCDSAMVSSHTKKGNRLYRYYVCSRAQKRGWQSCPCPSLPAQDIEALVVDCIRGIGKDPELVKDTLGQWQRRCLRGRRSWPRNERSSRGIWSGVRPSRSACWML